MLHILATVKALTDRGVTLVSTTDRIDSSTAAGRMMIGVLGSLAEYERELVKERTALKREALPQAVMTAKYSGAARLAPEIDAFLEPWTALGYLAGRHRFNRARLGTCVTDAGRRNPAVTAQAAATLHLMTEAGQFSGSEPANAKATSPTGWTGPGRWHGSKKPWQPYGRYGTRTGS